MVPDMVYAKKILLLDPYPEPVSEVVSKVPVWLSDASLLALWCYSTLRFFASLSRFWRECASIICVTSGIIFACVFPSFVASYIYT